MLSTPKHGWVDIAIGDWSDRASYLTDVPLDILNALINLLQNYKVSCVRCDAEGWEYIMVFDFDAVYIIDNKEEKYKLHHFDINISDLAIEIYKDIKENLYAWSLWDYSIENEKERLKRENKIKEKLDIIKKKLHI